LNREPLRRRREPFDHPEWIFELKYDGFRALFSIGGERPAFVSRKANAFAQFSNLASFIDRELHAPRYSMGKIASFDAEPLIGYTQMDQA
jgi:bifunctional non-homologous end joining protein LigD